MSDETDGDDQRHGPDRRGLMALAAVFAALAVCAGVLLATRGDDAQPSGDQAGATSSDPDDTADEEAVVEGGTDPSDPTSTTVPDTTVDTTRAGVTQGVADGIYRGADGVISQDEANCMAEALVNEIGVERLVELGDEALGTEGESNPLAALTPAEQDAAVAAMLPCADAETLGRLSPGS